MMKVLQINTYYKKGSTGKIVEQLLETQKNSYIDGYVLYGKGDLVDEPNVYKINTKLGYYYHKFMTHVFGKHSFYSKRKTKKAMRIIEQIKPDVIHLHNLHGHYLNVQVLFNYILKNEIPVVWTFHDCWAFTGHCAYFHEIGCEKWKTGCFKCELKYSYPRSFIFDRSKQSYIEKKRLFTSIRNINLVNVSRWVDGLVSESFFMDKPHSVIYNWIDRDIFNGNTESDWIRKKYNIDNKFVILGVAAGWTERKGIRDFVELSNFINDDEVIFLIGSAPTNLTLPKGIINIPAITDQTLLAQYYAMADVYINPSRQETFGLTTAEAMSCGTPAIVYDVTACPEIVGVDEKCGYIAKAYEVSDIYSKIKKIKLKGKSFYSINAIQRVEQLFDNGHNLNEYIKLYREVTNKNDDIR